MYCGGCVLKCVLRCVCFEVFTVVCVLMCLLRCVVRYEAIVPGNQELVVLYRGQLYNMATEEKLEQFMR